MSKKVLIVIDMQNDFITGVLGTREAEAIVPKVIKKIQTWDGDIIATADLHFIDSYNTLTESRYIPQHCIMDTWGQEIEARVDKVFIEHTVPIYNKFSFGSMNLAKTIEEREYDYIEIIGLCTDICIISNALLIQNRNKEAVIAVSASCCAGTTPEMHEAALKIMKNCCIQIID